MKDWDHAEWKGDEKARKEAAQKPDIKKKSPPSASESGGKKRAHRHKKVLRRWYGTHE